MSDHSIEDLERPEPLSHQRWEWRVERVGWGMIASVVLIALLGGLGPGLFGKRRVASPDGSLVATYYVIERAAAPNLLELEFDAGAVKGSRLEVAISRSLAESIQLDSLVPSPISSQAGDREVVCTFATEELKSGSKIICRYQHEEFGVLDYQVGLRGHSPIEIRQWVLP